MPVSIQIELMLNEFVMMMMMMMMIMMMRKRRRMIMRGIRMMMGVAKRLMDPTLC